MRFRTIIAAAAIPAAAGGVLLTATGASAATVQPASLTAHHAQLRGQAFGSVELGSPEQYAQFWAIQEHGFKGFVDYTNFTAAEPGSGVWAPASQGGTLTFMQGSTPYAHTLNGGLTLVALSPDHLRFSGTGEYVGTGTSSAPQYTWNIKGDVRGDKVSYTITYNGLNYEVVAHGTIANDGSASGQAEAGAPGSLSQALSWTLSTGSFQSVLHYIAPVKDVQVQPKARTAQFDFVIPKSVPGYGTTPVTVKVHAGNAAHATWAHGVGLLNSKPAPSLANYPVEAGGIRVLP